MSALLSFLVLATAAASVSSGCSVATEYVPQTPGHATIGVQTNDLGIYKNGTFTSLTDAAPVLLGCSSAAATTARRAAGYRGRAVRTAWIAVPFYAVGSILPPLLAVAVILSVSADDARSTSFALAVDAVNLHNDTAECFAPAAPVVGAHP